MIEKDVIIVESVNDISGRTKNDNKNREKVVVIIKKYCSHIKEEMDFVDYRMSNKMDDNVPTTLLKTHPYKIQ